MGTTLLLAGGMFHVAFIAFHILFWKIFRWKADLRSLTTINRGIMQILNLRLIYVFLLFAVVSFVFPGALQSTPLGRFLMASISLFWLGRAIEQIVFYGIVRFASVVLFVVCLAGCGLYMLPLFVE